MVVLEYIRLDARIRIKQISSSAVIYFRWLELERKTWTSMPSATISVACWVEMEKAGVFLTMVEPSIKAISKLCRTLALDRAVLLEYMLICGMAAFPSTRIVVLLVCLAKLGNPGLLFNKLKSYFLCCHNVILSVLVC